MPGNWRIRLDRISLWRRRRMELVTPKSRRSGLTPDYHRIRFSMRPPPLSLSLKRTSSRKIPTFNCVVMKPSFARDAQALMPCDRSRSPTKYSIFERRAVSLASTPRTAGEGSFARVRRRADRDEGRGAGGAAGEEEEKLLSSST